MFILIRGTAGLGVAGHIPKESCFLGQTHGISAATDCVTGPTQKSTFDVVGRLRRLLCPLY